jgi:hypothetical protein
MRSARPTFTKAVTAACPFRVKSGNAHNEPMMSAFHPIATEQRTQFYVGLVPNLEVALPALMTRVRQAKP